MSDEKSGPHDGLEGERQEAHDEASASAQGSNSGHVEVFSPTAQEKVRNSASPSSSPQLSAHEKAHGLETSSSGPQPPLDDKAQLPAQRPLLSPQPPTHEAHSPGKSSHNSQVPTHMQEQQRASVKGPQTEKRKDRPVRANRKHDKRERNEEERKLENERRLDGQRLEYERKLEARRKAEDASAAARAQTEGDKHQQQSLMEESMKVECKPEEDAERGSPVIKMDDDQKVHNDDDAETVGESGPRVLEHDTGATCLAITGDEHSRSHLIMMSHGLGYCYYGKHDVTRLGHYSCQCSLVREDLREDSWTRNESNYLFHPPLLRWPSPKPVESVQTCQDTDALFYPSLERSGDSAGTTPVVTVNIPKVKTECCLQNTGVSTATRDTTHDFQRSRRAIGRGGYRTSRSRGRGGRGPKS